MKLRDIVVRNRMMEHMEVTVRVETELKSVFVNAGKEKRISLREMEEEGTDILIEVMEKWGGEE